MVGLIPEKVFELLNMIKADDYKILKQAGLRGPFKEIGKQQFRSLDALIGQTKTAYLRNKFSEKLFIQ